MKKIEGFIKYANSYEKYNIIQKEIIKKYLPFVKTKVVDLGCGSIGLCKYKKFEFYLGIDISKEMLKLNLCNTKQMDFNKKKTFEFIKTLEFEQIISFSALQWADNLDFIFNEIKNLNKSFLLTLFTSNTFKTLHNFLEITSPIYSKEEILNSAKILNPKVEILNYKLEFNLPYEMLKYIKLSGVKGDVFCKISKLKEFIKTFPFNYLEFEIIVLKS